ncbi:MAG: PH domain-containing protein [Chloroflexaceae bacterium]
MPDYTHRNVKRNIDFRPDERILSITHRHIAALLARLLPVLLLLLLFGGIVGYRGMGGQFLEMDTVASQQFTSVDLFLLITLTIVFITGIFVRGRIITRVILWGVGLLLAGLLYFRYTGGRTFAVEPGAGQSFDTFNVILIIIMMLALAYAIYAYIDWKRDRLILTNRRVIREMDRPLIWHVQEQLPINDIQSVEARTLTYVGHWVNLGYVKVQSASFNKAMFFSWANDPGAMQARIMEQVNKLGEETEEAEFARLIEKRVYSDEADKLKYEQTIRHSYTPHALNWLFPMNPEFDREESTYTWRRHWFFLVESAFLPMVICIIGFVLVSAVAGMDLVGGGVLLVLLLPLLLVCAGWMAWKIQDYRNDHYILTPVQVVYILKRPLGPESRQSAGLDAVQNITYKATLFGRIFGFGDVLLETAGPAEGLTFYEVPNPREVVATIDSYQTAYNQSQKERNMEDTLKLLRFYHMTHEQEVHAEPADDGEQQNQADQTAKQ